MSCTPANGTKLAVDQASTSVFTNVADLVNLEWPDMTRPDIECTDLDSEAEEFDPGSIPNYGEVKGTINFKPASANHLILTALFVSGAKVPWKLIYADEDETEWPFNGYLKQFKPGNAEVNGKITAEFTIKVSGKITLPT